MNHCEFCGSEVREGSKFCPKCGRKVEFPLKYITSYSDNMIMPENRSCVKMILLGLITLGIYSIFTLDSIVTDLNIVARPHDKIRQIGFGGMSALTPITLGIYTLYWYHVFFDRVGRELRYRHIPYDFGPLYFWIFDFLLGWTIIFPIIAMHKLCKSINLINHDFNLNGK